MMMMAIVRYYHQKGMMMTLPHSTLLYVVMDHYGTVVVLGWHLVVVIGKRIALSFSLSHSRCTTPNDK